MVNLVGSIFPQVRIRIIKMKKKMNFFPVFLFAFITFAICFASLAAEEDLYRLKVGDKLFITVYNEKNTRREITIGPTGTICYLFLNSVQAEGKTIPELRADLTEKLKKNFRFPELIINGNEFMGEHYTVNGEVRKPGKKPLEGHATIIKALGEAGGFTTRLFRDQTIDLVDFDHSFLSRNGEYVPVDFSSLILEGDMSQNLPLKTGDYIYMASYVMPQVYVLGEVNRSLTINYLDTITLAEAIAQANGVTRRASSRAVVIRGALARPTVFEVDINRIFKAYACDFFLEPGDIVYVPPMKFTYLKEIVQGGIASFISILANVAGTNVFLEITPKAKAAGVASPVPVIGTTPTVIPAPAPVP